MLQVKVPDIFFGTPVFSACRDGRYHGNICRYHNLLQGPLSWGV